MNNIINICKNIKTISRFEVLFIKLLYFEISDYVEFILTSNVRFRLVHNYDGIIFIKYYNVNKKIKYKLIRIDIFIKYLLYKRKEDMEKVLFEFYI